MVDRLEEEFENQLESIKGNVYDHGSLADLTRKKYFKKLDDLLHALQSPEDELGRVDVKERMAEFLEAQDTPAFNVIAFSIMNNHIHCCIATNQDDLSTMLEGFKNNTARLLENKEVWSQYTNIIPVQNRDELAAMMNFIVDEPVERELSEERFSWFGTFVRDKYFPLLKRTKSKN